jgi:hypothetical protein
MLCAREGSGICDGLVQGLLANTGVPRKSGVRFEQHFFGISNERLFPVGCFRIYRETKGKYAFGIFRPFRQVAKSAY